jgi:AraC-like DNA-binding protein
MKAYEQINEKYLELVFELVNWINLNLDSELDMDVISYKSGYSKWHLHRIFKDVTGDNIWQYIIHRRLLKASYDLAYSENSIIDIATIWQFDSQQSFTRAFRCKFNITPNKYRISFRNEKVSRDKI